MPGSPAMDQGGGGAGQHGGQGSPAAPRRAAGEPGPAQEQPAACAGGIARRPRRRGGVPGSMAPELKKKGVGEDEGSVGKLTAHSNRTEEGRKVELDGRGRGSERPSMAAGGEVVDSAGDWLERARDGAEEVEGKAREVGARGIERGDEVWPVRRRRRHCSTRLRPSSRRTKGGENGIGHRDWISTARAVVESNGAATRRHKHREWRRAAPSRRETEREGRDERDMMAVS